VYFCVSVCESVGECVCVCVWLAMTFDACITGLFCWSIFAGVQGVVAGIHGSFDGY